MAEYSITLPTPHAGQQQIIAEQKRFNVVSCGRRFGKTVLGIDQLIHAAINGNPVAWFAPTYKQQAEAWREVLRSLGPLVRHSNQTDRRIELATGGTIEFWSVDSPDVADAVRGRKYALAIVDEAATVRDLLEVFFRVIRPTLADLKGGVWFLSTPRGYNGFYTLFSRGLDPQQPDWAAWRMPTSSNPYIEAGEIESMRVEMTEASFAQEVMAEFCDWEGAVFRGLEHAFLPDGVRYQFAPHPQHDYVIGGDWGRSLDFTVFTVLDLTAKLVVHIERSNQHDYAVQRSRLKVLRDYWRPVTILVEANSIGQPIIEQLIRDGIKVKPWTATNATKAAIIEGLALAFEQREIRIIPHPVLLAELQAFRSEVLPSGLIRYSAPAGMHDDCVISLALAWSAVGKESRPQNPFHSEMFPYTYPLGF